jgi:RNA polymerase sigma-70 factor (ECF subfamily)
MIEVVDAPTERVPTPQRLAEDYAVRVLRFATLLCRNPADAEDLAQEAMIRALRGLGSYEPRGSGIEAWLWRIAVNTARDAGRIASRSEALWERLVAARPGSELAEDTESVVLRRLADAELVAQVRRLSRREQTLIALRYGAGLSYEEMGELLDQRPSALRQGVHRALGRLRTRIENQRMRKEETAR